MKALAWHLRRRRSFQRLALCCLATGLLLDAPAGTRPPGAESESPLHAVSPEELGYSVTHWTVADGLVRRIVTSLAQTPDGYLWCGGGQGLARFDGAHFTLFQHDEIPALKDLPVIELQSDTVGRLWIRGIDGQLAVL